MYLESRNILLTGAKDPSVAREEPRLHLPGILGNLAPEEKAVFDDLMMSVVPWRGEGYTLGLNGLFQVVPLQAVEAVTRYVNAPRTESTESTRQALLEELGEIFKDRGFTGMRVEELRSFA